MLASGALIASLLAVGASPAGAESVHLQVDEPIETSACVGGALDDHMFTDVSDDHAFRDEINCVAYYQITNGTGDGSTYSPNLDVSRAEMAVFIARAADVAGVDLGDAMDEGFTDIDDIWGEAQDAINELAGMGMIPDGGEFRPHDAITRAEMATFLVGLLAEGAPNVTIDEDGIILLGAGGSAEAGTDYFADARAAVPRSNDDQITALYELGVTKGASAIPGGPAPADVLVTTYTTAIVFVDHDNDSATPSLRLRNPQGSSWVRTIPLTLDEDGSRTFSVSGLVDTAPSAEVDKYEVDIRVQHRPDTVPGTGGQLAPLPYNYEPHGTVDRGQMAAFITRALAHTQARPEGITAQFTGSEVVVSVRDADYAPISNSVVDLFRIDTSGIDLAFRADGSCNEAGPMDSTADTGYTCEIDGTDGITGSDGDVSVGLGDDVDTGGTTVWIWTGGNEDTVDDESELFRLDISEDEVKEPATGISVTTEHGGEKAHQGRSVLYTVQVVDKDGDPASSYSRSLPFVDSKGMRLPAYRRTNANAVSAPGTDNASYNQFAVADSSASPPTGTGGGGWDADANNAAGEAIDAKDADGAVIFSTEDGVLNAGDIFVKVEPAAEFAVVDNRGATNRATVTVTDQYGDPISGVQVRLDSTDDSATNNDEADTTKIVAPERYLSVGRDGSYSFGYESFIEDSSTETLTATIAAFDHDGDEGTAALMSDTTAADALVAAGSATVEWAVEDTDGESAEQPIRAFDTEMNTIFAGGDSEVQFVTYDSNDRFNIDRPEPDPDPDPDEVNAPSSAATYAEFEKALSKAEGYELTWTIVGRGSRATNEFNLFFPGEGSN